MVSEVIGVEKSNGVDAQLRYHHSNINHDCVIAHGSIHGVLYTIPIWSSTSVHHSSSKNKVCWGAKYWTNPVSVIQFNVYTL